MLVVCFVLIGAAWGVFALAQTGVWRDEDTPRLLTVLLLACALVCAAGNRGKEAESQKCRDGDYRHQVTP